MLDDAHDEGEETLTLTLSNAAGARIADGEATGTIANADPLQKMWLARFGRSVASQAVAAVAERLALPAGSGSRVTLGGERLSLEGQAGARGDAAAATGAGPEPGTMRRMSGREVLLSSTLHMVSEGRGGDRFAGWGHFGAERFRDTDGGLPVEGEVTTAVFGADWERGDWLAGLALTHSIGEGEMRPRDTAFDYGMESTVTALTPYLRLKLSERMSVWGLAAHGAGGLEMTAKRKPDDAQTLPGASGTYRTDIATTLGAVGARGALLTPAEADGYGLTLKGDAFRVAERVLPDLPPGGRELPAMEAAAG